MRRALPVMVLLSWLLEGCTSWKVAQVSPVAFVDSARPAVVRLTLPDSTRVVLRNPVVRGDSIEGQDMQAGSDSESAALAAVAGADVRQLEIRHEDAGKEVALGLGVAVAAAVVFFGTILAIWAVECSAGCD